MFHSEENIPFPVGQTVYFVNQAGGQHGIQRGVVKSIEIIIEKDSVRRTWNVMTKTPEGELKWAYCSLENLALDIEHAVKIAEQELLSFKELSDA